jgi:hypothetical protein
MYKRHKRFTFGGADGISNSQVGDHGNGVAHGSFE